MKSAARASRQRLLDAARRDNSSLRAAADEPRHDVEVEHVLVPAAERRTQRPRLLAGGGMNECRAQDIGQPHDQRVDGLAEYARLRRMCRLPQMRQEPGRHRRIAADHFAVELQCVSGEA